MEVKPFKDNTYLASVLNTNRGIASARVYNKQIQIKTPQTTLQQNLPIAPTHYVELPGTTLMLDANSNKFIIVNPYFVPEHDVYSLSEQEMKQLVQGEVQVSGNYEKLALRFKDDKQPSGHTMRTYGRPAVRSGGPKSKGNNKVDAPFPPAVWSNANVLPASTWELRKALPNDKEFNVLYRELNSPSVALLQQKESSFVYFVDDQEPVEIPDKAPEDIKGILIHGPLSIHKPKQVYIINNDNTLDVFDYKERKLEFKKQIDIGQPYAIKTKRGSKSIFETFYVYDNTRNVIFAPHLEETGLEYPAAQAKQQLYIDAIHTPYTSTTLIKSMKRFYGSLCK